MEEKSEEDDRWLTSFDDSSDEEDIQGIKGFSALDSFNEFESETYNHKVFFAHALGIQVLYSERVHEKYYNLKKTKLSYEEDQLPIQENIENWLSECLKEDFTTLFKLPKGSEEIQKKINNDFLDKNEQFFTKIVTFLTINPRSLFQLLAKGQLKKKLDEYVEEFNKLKEDYLGTLDTIQFVQEKTWTVANLKRNVKGLGKELEAFDSKDLGCRINALPKTPTDRISSKVKVKKKYIKKMPKESFVDRFIVEEYEKLSTSNYFPKGLKEMLTPKLVNKRLHELCKHKEASETYEKVKDLLLDYGFIGLDTDTALEYIEERINIRDCFKQFITRLMESKSRFIKEHMQDMSIEDRKTLDVSEIFFLSTKDDQGNSDFFFDFMAHLRLCNRSMKRVLQDRIDLDSEYKYSTDEGFCRSWKFPVSKYHVIDIQRLSSGGEENKPLRKDQTESLGSYQSIFERMEQIKSLANTVLKEKKLEERIEDYDIANWLKLIVKGSNVKNLKYYDEVLSPLPKRLIENILKELVGIAYIMFGTEVARNPASLICNHMMLDLIQREKMSWKEALNNYFIKGKDGKQEPNGGEMPMSMKNATPAARILHHELSKFMPDNHYTYDKYYDTNNLSKHAETLKCLIKREDAIISKWLETIESDVDHEDQEQVLTTMYTACKEWYEIELPQYESLLGDSSFADNSSQE